ncbi:MAG: TPM domain-containing protein [Polyangiaceae bacterium]
MKRSSLFRPLAAFLPFFLSFAVVFSLQSSFATIAWAKFVPPPLKEGHIVTMVGWIAPFDQRKINEEADIAQSQTGYVIDILLAPSDEPIEEISTETFQAWKPGDPKKDNGILLVIQPNFPRGQRKVRLQVGKGVEAALPAAKASEIMRNTIGPLVNGADEIRTAVASGVLELAKTLGADVSLGLPPDAGPDAATPDGAASGALAPTAGGTGGSGQAGGGEGPAGMLWKVLGGFVGLVLAYVGLMWVRERVRAK